MHHPCPTCFPAILDRAIGINVQQTDSNDTGEMQVPIPIILKIKHQADVESVTQGLREIKLHIDLNVSCRCSKDEE